MTARGTPEEVRESLEEEAIDFAADEVHGELAGEVVGFRLPDDEEPWFALLGDAAELHLHRGTAGLARLDDAVSRGPGPWLRAEVGVSEDGEQYVPVFTARTATEAVREPTQEEQALLAVALAALNDAVAECLLPPEDPPLTDELPVLVVTDDGTHLTHALAWEKLRDDPALLERRRNDARVNAVLSGREPIAPGDATAWRLAEANARALLFKRLAVERQPDDESLRTYYGMRGEDVADAVILESAAEFESWLALRPNRTGDRASPLDRLLRRGETPPPQTAVLEALRAAPIAIVRVTSAAEDRVEVVDEESGQAASVLAAIGGEALAPGDVLGARLLALGEIVLLVPVTPVLRAEEIPDARELLARFGGELTAKSLNAKPHLAGRLWWWVYTPDEEDDELLEDE